MTPENAKYVTDMGVGQRWRNDRPMSPRQLDFVMWHLTFVVPE